MMPEMTIGVGKIVVLKENGLERRNKWIGLKKYGKTYFPKKS